MNKVLLKLRLLVTVLFLLNLVNAQGQEVVIRIQQQSSFFLDSFETTLQLKKDGFKIQVFLRNTGGVYLFAAFHDSLYKLSAVDPVPGFADLPGLAMAEESFNKDKELLISDEGWSYWFYDRKLDWHRFNKKIIVIDSSNVVGTKTVKYVYLVSAKRAVKLKDNNKPLYLFFVAVKDEDENGKPVRELIRKKVKIEWTNDD